MHLRFATTLLLLAALGCEQQTQAGDQPTLVGVIPSQLPVGIATPIVIEGTGLYVKMANDLTEPGPLRSQFRFSGELGGHPLEQLRWESNTQLHAISPAELPLGMYDLRIVTPDKRILDLENAVSIINSIGTWGSCPWWNTQYGFRSPLTVLNTAANPAELGYTVTVSIGHTTLVSAGKSRADGNDLRIIFCNGAGVNTELDRVDASVFATPDGGGSLGTADAQISFATARSIPAGSADSGYVLYYGNPTGGAAPSDPAAVYDFWEPFDDLAQWTVVNTPGEYITAGILHLDQLLLGGMDLLYVADSAGNRDTSVGFAVRARAKQLEVTDDLGSIGWYLDTVSGARYDLGSKSLYNRIRAWSAWNAPTDATLVTDSGANPPVVDQWYIYEATVEAQSFTYRRDGVPLLRGSDSSLSSGKVHVSGEAVRCRWDWLLIRLFVDPEPTVIVDPEQTQ